MKIKQGLVGAAMVLLVAATTTACTSSVDSKQLEDGVSKKVADAAGAKPSKLTCPELDAKKGAAVTCAMTLADQQYDVKVKVTSVDGSTVNYSIDPQPKK